MKIHEFQAKELLRKAGVPVPRSIVARTAEEAAAAFTSLGGSLAVVKAQIHAGGRGKGTVKTNSKQRGVELVKTPADAFCMLASGAATALDIQGDGKTVNWDNPDSGAKGSFTPVGAPFVVKDDICRAFLADLSGKLQPATLQGSACRAGPGDWTIKDAKPFSKSS